MREEDEFFLAAILVASERGLLRAEVLFYFNDVVFEICSSGVAAFLKTMVS